jgi:F-type H+-transporting ATPase subunit delta
MRQATRREPDLIETVDPDLLGGLVVQVGDLLYDASVRTQLDHIRNQLTERSSHEIQAGRDRFCTDDGN